MVFSTKDKDDEYRDVLYLESDVIKQSIGCKIIKEDLKKLMQANLISCDSGRFMCVVPGGLNYQGFQYDYVYIYEYDTKQGGHAMFSSVNYSNIQAISSTYLERKFQPLKCQFVDHDHCYLMPYLFSDYKLNDMLPSLPQELQQWFKKSVETYGMRYAAELNENEWTKRLHEGLIVSGIESEYTAEYQVDHKKSWRKRVPGFATKKMFLFRGTPDLIISNSGLLRCVSPANDINTDNVYNAADTDDEASSQDSGRVELGLRKCSTEGTFVTEKLGQLVAAVHQGLVCKALRKINRGEELSCLTGNGLLIDRGTSVIHVQIKLTTEKLKVYANLLHEATLDVDSLCNCIHYFLDQLKSK